MALKQLVIDEEQTRLQAGLNPFMNFRHNSARDSATFDALNQQRMILHLLQKSQQSSNPLARSNVSLSNIYRYLDNDREIDWILMHSCDFLFILVQWTTRPCSRCKCGYAPPYCGTHGICVDRRASAEELCAPRILLQDLCWWRYCACFNILFHYVFWLPTIELSFISNFLPF